jgi:hypothetical protein
MTLSGLTASDLGIPPTALPLAPGEVGYDPDELQAYLDDDASWRAAHPRVVGGPLRTADGQMAPVPAYMRLDLYTDRDGPVPEHAPHLGNCWVWTRGTVKGYAYLRVGKRKVQAYRLNYERWIGPIPAGAVMDHLCRVRRCVRPAHLDPTTYSENARRSPLHAGNTKAARTHCLEGHEYTAENTYWKPDGSRRCRACQAALKRQETGADPRPMATDTHCANGHSWEGNLMQRPGRAPQCATCNRLAGQAFRERQRAARAAAP